MEHVETIDDVLNKKGSIEHLWKIIDPENKFSYKTCVEEWYRMTLTDQRRLYLYLLYRKWRGDGFYGTPYEIVKNCHPYPTNWNGKAMINRLMKENKMVSAKYNGEYGIYTADEARVWEMTDIEPLNFRV
jgi:hypothetical protein